MEKVVRRAVERLGVEADILKVRDYDEIQEYPIAATPGLVVNEKLVCARRVPSEAEVRTWITTVLAQE